MCVLRERGRNEEADRVQAGELADALSAVRTPADTDDSVKNRLDAVFVTETDRVANAAVLAELLVPLLSDELKSLTVAPAVTAVPIQAPAKPFAPEPVKAPAPRVAAASIADFIDEMIAQEKPADRGARRAS